MVDELSTGNTSEPNAKKEKEDDLKDEGTIHSNQQRDKQASETKSNQAEEIKTETSRAGYVNIDGSERDNNKNQTNLSDILKEHINNYSDYVEAIKSYMEKQNENKKVDLNNVTARPVAESKVEVDDIIVPQRRKIIDKVKRPTVTKSKKLISMLPSVLQEFLNDDWKTKLKCDPQYMLERIRKEKRYPDHPDTDKYELLLTPAPSFLQRISLAGEFLNKKQLEMWNYNWLHRMQLVGVKTSSDQDLCSMDVVETPGQYRLLERRSERREVTRRVTHIRQLIGILALETARACVGARTEPYLQR
ncbi:hypothetical protein EVAR_33990_1 [Eumeta japonica]|uniref:Uncharacterized protein n=1 Tax=Eumeta variegata TaxID=151549 RepID=A0A4C1X197_EUMVA|nr:hypothetical protein EVAR_33990_1 [Eumeta japonica]